MEKGSAPVKKRIHALGFGNIFTRLENKKNNKIVQKNQKHATNNTCLEK